MNDKSIQNSPDNKSIIDMLERAEIDYFEDNDDDFEYIITQEEDVVFVFTKDGSLLSVQK